jgi:DNA-binding SARP family transcriptional activator/TolB-like protein
MTLVSDISRPQTRAGSRLRVSVFGPATASCQGAEVLITNRKALGILGYLVLSEASEETRERLVGLLWSESETDKARGSLRNALYDLSRALAAVVPDHFRTENLANWTDHAFMEADLWGVMEQAKRGDVHTLLLDRERITETILSNLENVDPSYSSWLQAKRQSIHNRLTAYLEDALRGVTPDVPAANREPLARALANLDPTHEEAARARIEARAAAGDVGSAFKIYEALWQLLEDDYDVEPSKETQDLMARLRLGQPATIAAPASASPVAAPAVLVPKPRPQKLILNLGGFDAAGVKPDNRYLVQGFRSELAACLVRFREWSVRDQPAAKAGGAQHAAAQEGEYIVDASAFETSEGVRLVLMLRDAATGEFVWSERLQLSVAEWFEAQNQIVRRLATALNVNLSAERLAGQSQVPDDMLSAYDLWLKAQSLHFTQESGSVNKAQEIFKRLVAQNPTFAPAYLGLANFRNIIHVTHPGIFRDRERTSEALRYAREAVRLEPVNSKAQLCLAWSHAMAGQPNEAHLSAILAQELNDNDPWTRVSTLNCRAVCGMTSDMRAQIAALVQEGKLIAPMQWAFHAITLCLARDFEVSLLAAAEAGDAFHLTRAWKTIALVNLGRANDAELELSRFKEIIRGKWVGSEPATDDAIARWMLQVHPFSLKTDWQLLRDGLAAAGLPTGIDYEPLTGSPATADSQLQVPIE